MHTVWGLQSLHLLLQLPTICQALTLHCNHCTGEAIFTWPGSEGLKGSVIDLALVPNRASTDMVVMPVWEQTIMNHKALGV